MHDLFAVWPVSYIWLLAGVALLLIEAIGLPGTGLMFAGFGAITAGALTYAAILSSDAFISQFIVFFIASAIWAVLLWKPLQKLRVGGITGKKPHDKHASGYSNIVGDTAYVGSSGLTRHSGEVTWSGTIMQARLVEDCNADTLEAGSVVTIVSVSGATLTVRPKI